MSTTIDVYPTTDYLPLVEETRARTQELFQELYDRHGINALIEVKAFYPSRDKQVQLVPLDVRWSIDLGVGMAYWINGKWDSSSFPSCCERDLIDEVDITRYDDEEPDYPAEMLGQQRPLEFDDFDVSLTQSDLDLLNAQDHYWYEYRNMGGSAVASTGYGLVAVALAEATNGRIASYDYAFNDGHNGDTAEQFLSWWGDEQIAFYGEERFLKARD